ncbi:uncharacterized protein LOC128883467 isoform X2 [Hylaeus volcanicus]|uniref:uncharacterized protein LOC128883467 isoform X2 n=1 Tax=Hylaeus volcanicus TaxID=313075 RepID=UPI0023B85E45|nr:uncharacterized protein LOC128883467 isoform X2 [Hylaeus volcanicus]
MLDGTSRNAPLGQVSTPFNVHQQLNDANCLFPQNSYQSAAVAAGVVNPFTGHIPTNPHHAPPPGLQQQHHHHHHQQNVNGPVGQTLSSQQHNAAAAAAAVAAMRQSIHSGLSQLSHGLPNASQRLASALFAGSPLLNDDLKFAAAAAAAAAVQSTRAKKTHRAEPVPQSGFKGVSWNSRMKAWLAFYVTENGERKSKTFSTRKLGMEEARVQAITFCKQKQEQRRERKRTRELQKHQHCNANGISNGNSMDKLNPDGSVVGSPARQQAAAAAAAAAAMRCGYPTTPDLGMNGSNLLGPLLNRTPSNNVLSSASPNHGSEIAYVPIVPIAMNMIEKSGLLQPLELNELPPCQHCNKQPYPFLMIVSEGQEQSYSGSSIINLTQQSSVDTASSTNNHGTSASILGGRSTEPSSETSGVHTTVSGTMTQGLSDKEELVGHAYLSNNMSKLTSSVL